MLCKPLSYRCLANAGFADENGIVFCPSGQNLETSLDRFISANDGVQPARLCFFGQIAPKLFEVLIRFLLEFKGHWALSDRQQP